MAYPNRKTRKSHVVVPDHYDCPRCGKRAYRSERAARLVARQLHGEDDIVAFRCGPAWHTGHHDQRFQSAFALTG